VPGVGGTWKELTDSVNSMASNLTGQVRNIAEVSTAIATGDLSKKITVNVSGEILLLKETINTMVDQLNAFAGEVTRVAREVGSEGRLGGQANVPGVAGTWKDIESKPDLIILDYSMPGMDGLRAAQEIFRALPTAHIVICTLFSSRALEIEAMKYGVGRVISKTEMSSSLLSAIEEIARKQKRPS
jgi:HAMP domain-containing protein